MTRTFDDFRNADTIDIRDVIERVEELRSERDDLQSDIEDAEDGQPLDDANDALESWKADNADELQTLEALLSELAGYGGDHQWEGNWYPVTLIADNYFTEYAEELASEVCDMKSAENWPFTCIDWEKAARELRMDYSLVTFTDNDYWYR